MMTLALAPGHHCPHILASPAKWANPSQNFWLHEGISVLLKGFMMNARFLLDEAARFRGMAVDADREATRVRFLAMAADYEARATASKGAEPEAGDTATASVELRPDDGLTEPETERPLTVKPARKIPISLKETIVGERRPVGRPRRE
jgi:hypothetical protein